VDNGLFGTYGLKDPNFRIADNSPRTRPGFPQRFDYT
jgi:hypothetical protein